MKDQNNTKWLTRESMHTQQQSARRVLWVGRIMLGIVTILLCALVGRVWQLETHPPQRIAQMVGDQISSKKIESRRGKIIGRRGRILAVTHVAHLLFVDPKLIKPHSSFEARVGYTFGIPPAHISKLIHNRPKSRFIVLIRKMSESQYNQYLKVKHNPDFSGLSTKQIQVRYYPQHQLAGQVIGFTGRQGKGLGGLELEFNSLLTSRPGQLSILRDARRRVLWIKPDSYKPFTTGNDLRLSIDVTIQKIAQDALLQAVKKFKAKSGQVVVMRPGTGEILAMANVPQFDPNQLKGSTAMQRKNRAVTNVFEPGSIFKPFVWSCLTELGAAKPDEIIDTTKNGVYITSFGRRLRDSEGHGKITWAQVLEDSSNIGMAKVAQRVSIPTLYKIVKRFHFGQTTGSGLPGEVGGLVNPLKRWNKYSQTSIPMGQEIAVTALQITRAFCAFANGGLLVRPRITAVSEAQYSSNPLIQTRVVSPAIALLTRDVLRKVVTEGTGRDVRSNKYKIFGKTGTAQVVNHKEGGYFQHKYVASFVGGAPLDNPQIVVGCFIQQPDPAIGHYGNAVSGPVVKEVVEQTLEYLGVPQRKDRRNLRVARR